MQDALLDLAIYPLLSTMCRYVREPLVCLRTNKLTSLCHHVSRNTGSRLMESIGYSHLALLTVEDESWPPPGNTMIVAPVFFPFGE